MRSLLVVFVLCSACRSAPPVGRGFSGVYLYAATASVSTALEASCQLLGVASSPPAGGGRLHEFLAKSGANVGQPLRTGSRLRKNVSTVYLSVRAWQCPAERLADLEARLEHSLEVPK